MGLTFNVKKVGDKYTAYCQELDIRSYAKTHDRAYFRLKNMISFYATTALELGYNIESKELSHYITPLNNQKTNYLN